MSIKEAAPFGDGTSANAGGAALIAWSAASQTLPASGTFAERSPLSVA
ncbi:hypothetical protein ABT117_16710 [Streptomyces sp. NPDC002262]